ncbi:hypothetical protein [Pseudoalteromonas ruthenica]|uniref:hypothetical protein n=1 Tax=Pseudoalteromonas ruthenica TaxID=151081 RepID=UPI00241FAE5C|nr:hypothetical protein [Pseudoalteromonas ruthenica]|tara:strand:- start:21464 stop:21736 length:273 start_codon:yes stop_codon:yes gene_type:complete
MELKDLELSDYQENEQKQATLTCSCCRKKDSAGGKVAMTKEQWIYAANYSGWRHVITKGTDMGTVCGSCVDEMENTAQPLSPSLTGMCHE